jgi:hypothetical protein
VDGITADLLNQYVECRRNPLVIPDFRTTSTDDHLRQLAKVKAAILATLDDRIPCSLLSHGTPSPIENAVAQLNKGATIRGFSIELEGGKRLYGVKLVIGGRGKARDYRNTENRLHGRGAIYRPLFFCGCHGGAGR